MTDGAGLPTTAPAPEAVPPPRSARRRWILPIVAVAVVAVVLVAALFAAGVLRFGPANSPPPADQTFSQAESQAQSGANSVPGGPWYAVFGIAVVTRVAVLEPVTSLSSDLSPLNCTFAWPNGQPANIALPATSSGAAAGTSAYWAFGLKNQSNTLLLESVSDGTASAVLTARGGTCAEGTGYLVSFPSGFVDSPAMVSAVGAAGGTPFLAANPNATQVWVGVAGITIYGFTSSPVWEVAYTSCSLPPVEGQNGSIFNATVGGTSGVVTGHANGTGSCLPAIPGGLGIPPLPLASLLSPVAARKAI
jgi:hypothetical protein